MVVETKKILDPKIKVSASCVRVPVFIGHAEMVNVEFEKDIGAKEAKRALAKAPGVTLIDLESDMEYVTPEEIVGEDDVFVSRLREDPTVENGLNFWCVSDNLRKGAALNAVQIAEKMIADGLI
jgi:aspartate-semialdehyde dehydrogenase